MRARVLAAQVDDHTRRVARTLPANLRLGATNWTTRRWEGFVWRQPVHRSILAREGLPAYAQHPLLRTVLIDRCAGVLPSQESLRRLAAATPQDFRFVLAADELPLRGYVAGAPNPLLFDPRTMIERSVVPFVEGLDARAGVLLIRVPSQDPRRLGTRRAFPERLHNFLRALPAGPRYAVELRDHKLLTPAYRDALRDCAALHCVTVDPSMSGVADQVSLMRPLDSDTMIVRWSMREHFDYRAAVRNYAPYDAIIERDERARGVLVPLLTEALAANRKAYVLVDNMAEGCAPATIAELADALVTADVNAMLTRC